MQEQTQQPAPEEIRAARLASEHTQTQAAQLVHVDLRSWQRWEAGDRLMPIGLWDLYRILTDQHPMLHAPRRRRHASR